MNGRLHVILDPPRDPAANMAADERVSRLAAEESRFVLRIYRWDRPAVSLGRRQKQDNLPASLLNEGLPRVWRPTGGGAVLHRLDELTYAFSAARTLLPAALPLREISCLLHRSLLDAVLETGKLCEEDFSLCPSDPSGPVSLCFSSPAKGDLLYQGRKVCGAALRVWKDRILLQGSVQGLPLWYNQLAEMMATAVRRAFGQCEETQNFPSVHRCGR